MKTNTQLIATLTLLAVLCFTTTATAQRDFVSQVFPFALAQQSQPDGSNGTYFIVNDEGGQFIIAHSGLGNQQTLLYLSGHVGAMFLGARVLHLAGNENIFINNHQLVIGEPDSGGKGLRSLSVMNDPQQRTAFDQSLNYNQRE